MEYIFVTFKLNSKKEIDLKVPVFIKVEEFIIMLSEVLNFPISSMNRLQCEPLGRILDNGKTLKDEGVGDGALLTLI